MRRPEVKFDAVHRWRDECEKVGGAVQAAKANLASARRAYEGFELQVGDGGEQGGPRLVVERLNLQVHDVRARRQHDQLVRVGLSLPFAIGREHRLRVVGDNSDREGLCEASTRRKAPG